MRLISKVLKNFWPIFLLIILSFWTVRPLLKPGFFPVHDDTQVVRVYEMTKALKDGQFPVRWVKDLGYGYGYPIFNFYGPLPYYVGAFFNILGLGAILSTKLMFLIGIVLAGLSMFLFARDFLGKTGAIIAAVFYLYAPYHALDIYVRGAVGEFWAMGFLPLVFLGTYKIFQNSKLPTTLKLRGASKIQNSKTQFKIKNDTKNGVLIGAIGLTGIILSHNITAMLTMLFIFVFLISYLTFSLILKKANFSLLRCYFTTLLLSLGLSAFFWLPAITEAKYTRVNELISGRSDYHLHFVYPEQLWNWPWGFGGSNPGKEDGLSFKIGKLHILLAIFSLFLVLGQSKKKTIKDLRVIFVMAVILLLSIFMTTEYSLFIWEKLPPLAFTQYPWRFLVFTVFSISFLCGSLFKVINSKFLKTFLFLLLLFSVIVMNSKYFQPKEYIMANDDYYLNEENIKWKTSKISDEYLSKDFLVPLNSEGISYERISDSKTQFNIIKDTTQEFVFLVKNDASTDLNVNIGFFPGWSLKVDGNKEEFFVKNGKINIIIPEGEHRVELKFGNTKVRNIANALSIASLVLLGFIYVKKKSTN